VVTDTVTGARGARLDSFLHLHPDIVVTLLGRSAELAWPGGSATVEWRGVDEVTMHRGEMTPVQGWFCPEFGVARPAPCIVATVRRNAEHPFGYRITPQSRAPAKS
jgi:hypothetical protein